MTVNRYFTLTNSNASLSKFFRVALDQYSRPIEKKGSEETTLDGEWDIQRGGIYRSFKWIIMVREEETDEGYGDIHDLETFFTYNDPNGDPSDVLTLVTNEGDTYLVAAVGTMDKVPIGVMIVGTEAWYYPQIEFKVLSGVTPS